MSGEPTRPHIPSSNGDAVAPSARFGMPQIEGYQIVGDRPLAEPSMGAVWKAIQLSTKREVALKLISPAFLGADRIRARFEREIELAANLEHPNIARVYDSGIRQGVYCYAMEFISGQHLDTYVIENHLSRRQILELMEKVCRAIQYAHQRGIIHADLKPSNVLATADGEPHVLDFGLAKLQGESNVTVSRQGDVMAGTPPYMSPEQAAGRRDTLDIRSDVYTLGVILYELLIGCSPYGPCKAVDELLGRIREGEVRRPRAVSHTIDRELEALLLKAMALTPAGRYQSAGELAHDIINYLTGEPLTAKKPTTTYFILKRLRKHRLPAAVGGAIFAVLLGVVVFSYIRISQERNIAVAAREEADRERRHAEAAATKAKQAELAAVSARKQEEQQRRRAEFESCYNAVALADKKCEEFQSAQALDILETVPARLRQWEWRRVMLLCNLDLRTFQGHSNSVTSVAFSPDGKWVLTGSGDKTAKLWDAEMGQELRTFQGHSKSVTSVAFSRDGKRVLTGSDDATAKLWDADTGQELLTFQAHTDMVTSVAFSSDGRRVLTGSRDTTAKLWDADTGRELLTLHGQTDLRRSMWFLEVTSVAFSPDSKRVLTGSEKKAILWDADTGQELRTFQGHADQIVSMAFSSDGKQVLTGSRDNTAKLWDADTGQVLRTLQGHSGFVNSVAFGPDNKRVLTGSADRTAKLWDADTGRDLLTLQGHSNSVTSVAFSSDGKRVLTGSRDKTAKLWDADTGRELLTFPGHADEVSSVAFSPDGKRVLTGSSDKTAKLWDADTGRELLTLQGQTNLRRSMWFLEVTSAAFSPDSKRVLTGSEKKAILWDADTGQELRTFQGHADQIVSMAFSSDGKQVLTGSRDNTAKLWDADTGQVLRTLQGHSGFVNSVAFGPDNKRVLTGSADRTAKLWDADTGRDLLTLQGHASSNRVVTFPFTSVAFSPDGKRVLTGSSDKTAKLWDADTGRELLTFKGHASGVQSVALSSDGKRVLTGSSDKTAKLWDADTGRELRTFQGHTDEVMSVAFSPDGRWVMTGSHDETAKLWDSAVSSGYSLRGQTVIFEFNKNEYFLDSTRGGSSVAMAGITNVCIAGEFNAWSPDRWPMRKVDDSHFVLERNLREFRGKPSWQFKFIVNNSTPAEPTSRMANRERSPDKPGVYNLALVIPEE